MPNNAARVSAAKDPEPSSPVRDWLAWLLRVFTIEDEDDEDTIPTAKVVTARGKAPAQKATDAPPLGSGATAYARFAGIDLPLTPPDWERPHVSESLKEEVLSHVFQHKPGPNSFPTLSTRILNLLSRPDDVDINDLVRLVSQDTALSVCVLRAANSAGLRGLSEIVSVRDAITRMGLRDVSQVAGALASRSLFSPEARAEHAFSRERWTKLFMDASVIGMGAARLAMLTNKGRSDRAFLGGMLHDVGRSLVLKSLAMLNHQSQGDWALGDPEIDVMLDALHVVVGAEVQRDWKLPDYLVTLCERHHDVSVPDDPEFAEIHLVRVASGVRQIATGGPMDPPALVELDDSLHALRIDAFQFRVFHTELREIGTRMALIVGT